jgi:hypothetical protein
MTIVRSLSVSWIERSYNDTKSTRSTNNHEQQLAFRNVKQVNAQDLFPLYVHERLPPHHQCRKGEVLTKSSET